MSLIEVDRLGVSFWSRGARVRVLNDVSFQLAPGEIVGVLGESGSGKSVTASAVMGLIEQPPGRIEGGRILFKGMTSSRCRAHGTARSAGPALPWSSRTRSPP